ncbi:MAG: hypothetical protein ACD_25C00145G0003 [uncultured bacterium]|nr:MAG: hypothetical protein ACD_25C00145G0003 [uncultured bacterium]
MYKEAKYITTIPGNDKRTAYFLCKNPKVLVPMELKDAVNFVYPDLCTIFRHVLTTLKTEIISAKIYKFQDGVFYTYLTINQGSKYTDINIPPLVALKICKMLNAPILINEKIIREVGFCVTREMIDNALNNIPQNY